MADPHVAGAAAILIEAFPGLTGREVALILLQTATDLGDLGVDDVYGHGLLNLDQATQPIGDLTVALADNVNDPSVNLDASGINLSSAFGDALSVSDLQFKALDDYKRAYNVRLNTIVGNDNNYSLVDSFENFTEEIFPPMSALSENVKFGINTITQRQADNPEKSDKQKVQASFISQFDSMSFALNNDIELQKSFGFSATDNGNPAIARGAYGNAFLGFAESGVSSIMEIKLSDSSSFKMAGFADDKALDDDVQSVGFVSDYSKKFGDSLNIGVQFGFFSEKDSLLGSKTSGVFELDTNTPTWFAAMGMQRSIGSAMRLFGTLAYGVSFPEVASGSLISDITNVLSSSFNIGLGIDRIFSDRDNVTFTISQPLRVENANAVFDLPVGRDASGNIYRQNLSGDLTPSGREIDFELGYSYNIGDNSSVKAATMFAHQPGHSVESDNEAVFMIKFKKNF